MEALGLVAWGGRVWLMWLGAGDPIGAARRSCDVRLAPWLIGLVLLTGCAARVSVESLAAQGYKKSHVTRAATGMEEKDYELWWKETRGTERIARFCIVPKVTGRSYEWTLYLLVEEKGVWSYTSKELSSMLGGPMDPDCTVSGALPEGRLSWRVSFFYR